MSSIRAVVVDPSVPGRLAIRDVDYPSAKPSEALVRVHAISLNRGEVRRTSAAEAGWRPGWDLGGTCVNFGASESPEVTFDVRRFYMAGGATLYGFYLFYELSRNPGAKDLGRLASMIAEGHLHARIDVEAPWTEIGDLAQKLTDRHITGKAVLHISE